MKTVSIRVSDVAHKKLQDHYVATGISITRAASDCIVRHVYWGTKGATLDLPKKEVEPSVDELLDCIEDLPDIPYIPAPSKHEGSSSSH